MAPSPQIAAAPALKEWAVIVHALLEGEQIVDVRKGGLREAGRHFGLPASRFWLWPTAEHQRAELLKPAYARWTEVAPAAPVGAPITVAGWADTAAVATVSDPEALAALGSRTIWSEEYLATRFRFKARDPLWVLALRVHRLAEPITVPWDDAYGGCTSWVTLTGLPDDPGLLPSEPACSDVAFEARLAGLRATIAADWTD